MVLPAVALVLISLVSPLLDAFVFRQPLSGARAFIARAPRKAVAALPNDDGWLVLPDIWDTLSQKFPNAPMLCDPIHGATTELSYGQFSEYMNAAAWGLQKAGTRPGDCVSMFAENSHRWLIVDQAVMKAGGCNAVRGAKSSWDELRFIYANSRSTALVLDTATLIDPLFDASVPGNPLRERPPAFVVVLFSRDMTGPELAAATCLRGMPGVKVLSFEELLAAGYAAKDEFQPPPRNPESTATLVYTSGTTANPKGAMLSHKNLLYQVLSNTFGQRVDPTPGDVFLSILPVWHIFERSAEYFCLARGARMVTYCRVANNCDLSLNLPLRHAAPTHVCRCRCTRTCRTSRTTWPCGVRTTSSPCRASSKASTRAS
jgi:long-chain acyl-CoA synthetase